MTLDKIAVYDNYQRKGIGSNVLSHVEHCADLYHKNMRLFPGRLSLNVSPVSATVLTRWYKAHGFTRDMATPPTCVADGLSSTNIGLIRWTNNEIESI